jgi:pre-mRNA-splicing factor SYF1
MSFVLGKQVVKKRAGGKKKFPEMKEALEDAEEDLGQWETSLDPVVGWEEWKALVALFERALMWIPKVWWLYNFLFLQLANVLLIL